VSPARVTVRPLYTGLRVRNLERSLRFYRSLGFRQTLRMRTSIGQAAQLEHPRGRFTIELNQFRPGTKGYEPYRKGSEMDHFGFWVDDVDVWVRKLCRVGGKVKWAAEDCPIVIPPRPWFNGRAAMVADPDGIWIELMGPRRLIAQGKRITRGNHRGSS
jgi:catechol 2,3-dioxygenase-like lactoylglutathione lyase family enzyme